MTDDARDVRDHDDAAAAVDDGVEWLATHLPALSVRECWRLSTGVVTFVLFTAMIKVFRVRVPATSAIARQFLWVDRADSVPPWAAALFAEQEAALVEAGLQPVMTYSVRSLGADPPDTLARVFRDADGRALTQLMAVPLVPKISKPHLQVSCTSLTLDGVLIDTTNVRPKFDQDPEVRLEVVRGDAAGVVRRHRERIAALAVRACAADAVRERLAEEHARSLAFHERRGLYVPLSPARVAELRGRASPAVSDVHDTTSSPRTRRWPKRLATFVVWLGLVVLMFWLFGGVRSCREQQSAMSPPSTSDSPRRRPIEAKATEAQLAEALAPFRERLEASKRQVARVQLVPMQSDEVLASKVGGEPYLRAGEAPPRTVDGRDMVLLAQVNFAEVPAMRGYPSAGLLQFFIAKDSARHVYGVDPDARTLEARMVQDAFRVRYVEDVDPHAVAGRAPPRCGGHCDTPHDPDRPRRMRFELQDEPVSPNDVDFESVVGFQPYAWVTEHAAAWHVDEDDLAERALPTASGHKLGGYPYFTQDDPRPAGTPLRLLLQLDSDDEMMWGDAGVGAFFIAPSDLARRDFSRVLYSWDCY